MLSFPSPFFIFVALLFPIFPSIHPFGSRVSQPAFSCQTNPQRENDLFIFHFANMNAAAVSESAFRISRFQMENYAGNYQFGNLIKIGLETVPRHTTPHTHKTHA